MLGEISEIGTAHPMDSHIHARNEELEPFNIMVGLVE
jgi:hypothetical protein